MLHCHESSTRAWIEMRIMVTLIVSHLYITLKAYYIHVPIELRSGLRTCREFVDNNMVPTHSTEMTGQPSYYFNSWNFDSIDTGQFSLATFDYILFCVCSHFSFHLIYNHFTLRLGTLNNQGSIDESRPSTQPDEYLQQPQKRFVNVEKYLDESSSDSGSPLKMMVHDIRWVDPILLMLSFISHTVLYQCRDRQAKHHHVQIRPFGWKVGFAWPQKKLHDQYPSVDPILKLAM